MDKHCKTCQIFIGKNYKILSFDTCDYYNDVIREFCGEPSSVCGNCVCRTCHTAIVELSSTNKQLHDLEVSVNTLAVKREQLRERLGNRAKRLAECHYVAIAPKVTGTPKKGLKRILFESPSNTSKRADMKPTPNKLSLIITENDSQRDIIEEVMRKRIVFEYSIVFG